jgi:uncharacterized BrkB/YihY/UPF0761 family membrane protein
VASVVYEVDEGRPIWKKLPVRIGITIAEALALIVGTLAVVLTGDLARQAGDLIGLGANFDTYNETHGTLGRVIVFLVWLWITYAAVLLGAELNAELERQRQIEGGMPPDEEPFLEQRDATKLGHGP